MSDVTLHGFQISTYVNVVRLVLTHKGVPFDFHDLEAEMGEPSHLALHPFGRVPILDHGGFRVYETAAIATYVDEAFDGPSLQPSNVKARARQQQWISMLNGYFFPYIGFHLGHERLIYPPLGIAPDEKVVAVALPKIAVGLEVMESALAEGGAWLVGDQLTLADLFLLPIMTTLGLTPEGQRLLASRSHIAAWRARLEALPSVMKVRATVAPHIGRPVEHARRWATEHRPSVRSS